VIKLVSKIGIVLFQYNDGLGNIRRRLIIEGDIERGSFSKSEVMNVLPPTGFGFIEAKGFEGVGRDDGNRLSRTFLTI